VRTLTALTAIMVLLTVAPASAIQETAPAVKTLSTGADSARATEEEPTALLLDADWLASNLGRPNLTVVDVGRDIYEFEAGHIPGASFVDKEWLSREVDGVPGMLVSSETMAVVLDAAGVSDTSTVIIYDEAPGLWAARLFWALESYGHDDVHVLNGGWMNWTCQGFDVEAHGPHIKDGGFRPVPVDGLAATSEWILERLEDPNVIVLDVRTPEEFSGEEMKSSRGGRVPSAVHFEWMGALEPDGSGLFRPSDELLSRLAGLGVTPDREVVTYCQVGARAAHSYFMLKHLGFERVRVYDGSWAEWGNDPDLPVEGAAEPEGDSTAQ